LTPGGGSFYALKVCSTSVESDKTRPFSFSAMSNFEFSNLDNEHFRCSFIKFWEKQIAINSASEKFQSKAFLFLIQKNESLMQKPSQWQNHGWVLWVIGETIT
jgi:hypothetical protein